MRAIITSLCILLSSFLQAQSWDSIYQFSNGHSAMHFINADTGFAIQSTLTPYMSKTTDGGISWDSIALPFGGVSEDIDFANASVGYAVGGAFFPTNKYYPYSIIKTIDGGLTWDSVYAGQIFGGGTFNNIEVIDAQNFMAFGQVVAVRSTDGGLTVDTLNISSNSNESYEKASFVSSGTGYVMATKFIAFGNHQLLVYKTTDSGNNWQLVYSDTVANVYHNDIIFWDADNGLLTNQNGVLKTTDGGITWQPYALDNFGLVITQLEMSPDTAIYAICEHNLTNFYSIYRSDDKGETWRLDYQDTVAFNVIADLSLPTNTIGYFLTFSDLYKNSVISGVGIKETEPSEMRVFPNPADDLIRLELKEASTLGFVKILDNTGKVILEKEIGKETLLEIDTQKWKVGVYHVYGFEKALPVAYFKLMILK